MRAYSRVCPYRATSAPILHRPTTIRAMCAASARRSSRDASRPMRISKSVEQLKWQDVRAGRERSDTVALGAWGVEWHDRETFGSTFEAPPGGTAYSIPLDCLRSRDTANLFAAGRTADGDQRAGASLRVMGTSFATGQAAGVAAALFANDG